ncbi:MAG TPA: UDP-N-acetylmuramoyl-L-alanyl-D-glutamate--2,6-diaminopimelate ligase [Methylophilus sp.]|nr:UDP-N-acetylmuramoyl-L-alanyl-D-glutamate--2,6-diaminopimelate ligase [Methylophilus sp.]HQQ34269.1 UDP-N-acetylmuramoyl-L-alanyl-D-glutamate--2,6-diaminopimelate ligase [Methylophilus sp.]
MTLHVFNTSPTSIAVDSRQVRQGSLFLAYPGEKADGRQYIQDAIQNGAVAVLWEPDGFDWNAAWSVENLPVKNLRTQAGLIADRFYGHPSRQLWVVAVTGTNGKTSISQWVAQALSYLERKTAVIGTIGNGFPDALTATHNTTPGAVSLHGLLADYLQLGAQGVAMEVSSHGLDQGRLNGVHFDVAVLSNLTRDHLDYHGTMENYAAAKRKLFEMSDLKAAVINIDDEFGRQLQHAMLNKPLQVMTYGIGAGDVRASNIRLRSSHLSFRVHTPAGEAEVVAAVVGQFNVYNVLAVLATLLVSDVKLTDAVDAISHIKSVSGRMEQMGGGDQPSVVVDYAHTPDALENVLKALRIQTKGKLVCVFGCGGDRDPGKRALMGKVVSELADAAVVTSDNPRSEDPEAIIQQVLEGMHGSYAIEPDRAKAISVAIHAAQAGDTVLIAGKGHENYQEINGKKVYFSDVEQAKSALKRLQGVAV